jgi:predicted phosphodiesterase
MRITTIATYFLLLTILGCGDALDYTLFKTKLPSDASGLTAKHLERLQMLPTQDEFKIAVIADTHNYYNDLETIIELINLRTDISFVIVLGDITNIGLMDEFLRFHDIMKRLYVPYLTVIGNHDSLTKGKEIYSDMFGQFNYSFDYSGNRFVMLNSNELDFPYEAPDLNWLQSQLQGSGQYDNIIVFAHTPPNQYVSADRVIVWKYLMEQNNVKFSVNGHISFSYWVESNVDYVVVGDVRDINYGILSISKDSVGYERCSFTCTVLK